MTSLSVSRLLLSLALTTSGCVLVEPRYHGAVDVPASANGIVVSNAANYTVQVVSIAKAALPLRGTYPCHEGTRVLAGETNTFPWASR